jgi:hypothetical protein
VCFLCVCFCVCVFCVCVFVCVFFCCCCGFLFVFVSFFVCVNFQSISDITCNAVQTHTKYQNKKGLFVLDNILQKIYDYYRKISCYSWNLYVLAH